MQPLQWEVVERGKNSATVRIEFPSGQRPRETVPQRHHVYWEEKDGKRQPAMEWVALPHEWTEKPEEGTLLEIGALPGPYRALTRLAWEVDGEPVYSQPFAIPPVEPSPPFPTRAVVTGLLFLILIGLMAYRFRTALAGWLESQRAIWAKGRSANALPHR